MRPPVEADISPGPGTVCLQHRWPGAVPLHDLSPEIRLLGSTRVPGAVIDAALRREQREPFSIRRELLGVMCTAVAALVGGVGLLVKANLDRIGPVTLLCALIAAALLCYAVAWRARAAGRERSLGEDYVLL